MRPAVDMSTVQELPIQQTVREDDAINLGIQKRLEWETLETACPSAAMRCA